MRSRRHNPRKMDFDYCQSEQQMDDSLSQEYVKHKRQKKKVQRGARGNQKKVKNKNKKQDSESEQNSENQILQFKGTDQTMKQHYRPSFIMRWNGQDNQLEIYPEEYDQMSPMFKVYWEVKCKNMNAVIFLQLGKVEFFAFENDAILLNQIFKKRLKHFSSFLMVNFWSKQILLAKQQLFQRNIAVLMMNQIQDPEYREKNNLIRRQIDQVITPGIHLYMQENAYKQRWFMCVYILDQDEMNSKKIRNVKKELIKQKKQNSQQQQQKNQNKKCCVILLDSQTNKFFIEQFEIQAKLHQIRRVLNRYRPVQILTMKSSSQYIKNVKQIAKQISNPYFVDIGYQNEEQNVSQTLSKFMKNCNASIFKQMLSLATKQKKFDRQFSMFCTVKCLDILYQYLDNLKLKQKIFDQGVYSLSCLSQAKMKPFFDSQVYQNLQVFRIKNQQGAFNVKGTMISYLNLCQTNSGKKLLIRWLNQPLTRKQAIIQRQQSMIQLVQHKDYAAIISLHQKLIAYQKIQKEIADVYHWVLKNKKSKVHYLTGNLNFDKGYDQNKNPAIQRIKIMLQILKKLLQFQQFLQNLKKFQLKSKYFKKFLQLTSISIKALQKIEETQQEMKVIPNISELIKSIISKIDYNQANNYLEPCKGVCKQFDKQKTAINDLNSELQKELQKWKEHFKNPKICFAHVRARNQIQIPKICLKSRKDKPKQLIFSSQIAQAQRFTTARTIQISQQLMQREHELAKTYEPFMNQIINQFCQHKFIWSQYISAISEIDVLLSLAQVSKQMVPRCIPQFCQDDDDSVLEIIDGHHLGLMQTLQPERLVSNSLRMNKLERLLLLTGPNMGGKSTLLRQTCLLAILAQIGCYVPCKSYKSIVFDQIFCRIGAADRIVQGKSTFYVQLEETGRILKQATPSSLVIIDQLGRGTSTYDGMAIAQATIKFILDKISCYTLFSTHYTPITRQFIGYPEIICMKMSYLIENSENSKGKKLQKLKFLYQLQDGVAQKSFANNVARLVGLPEQILQLADKKANQIQKKHQQAQSEGNIQKVLYWMERKNIIKKTITDQTK